MSSFYAIMVFDRRKRVDVMIDRRVNRQAAERIVRDLNALAVSKAGPTAPLYYAELVISKVVATAQTEEASRRHCKSCGRVRGHHEKCPRKRSAEDQLCLI